MTFIADMPRAQTTAPAQIIEQAPNFDFLRGGTIPSVSRPLLVIPFDPQSQYDWLRGRQPDIGLAKTVARQAASRAGVTDAQLEVEEGPCPDLSADAIVWVIVQTPEPMEAIGDIERRFYKALRSVYPHERQNRVEVLLRFV